MTLQARTFGLGIGPDQASTNAVILLTRFGIQFDAFDASRGSFVRGHFGKALPPVLCEKDIRDGHELHHVYAGEREIRNFLRVHAIEADDSSHWNRRRFGRHYDPIHLEFDNTAWPLRSSKNLQTYLPCYCFTSDGQQSFKGNAHAAPYPVLKLLRASRLKPQEWQRVVAMKIGRLDIIRACRKKTGIFISPVPPAVLMPDELDTLLGGSLEPLVVDDSGGAEGVMWSRFDAYMVHENFLYRVWAYYQD